MHSFTKAEFYREKEKTIQYIVANHGGKGGQVPSFASMKLRQ
jgi:hypothetical protein